MKVNCGVIKVHAILAQAASAQVSHGNSGPCCSFCCCILSASGVSTYQEIHYVRPANFSLSSCPGQPCLTLGQYTEQMTSLQDPFLFYWLATTLELKQSTSQMFLELLSKPTNLQLPTSCAARALVSCVIMSLI